MTKILSGTMGHTFRQGYGYGTPLCSENIKGVYGTMGRTLKEGHGHGTLLLNNKFNVFAHS